LHNAIEANFKQYDKQNKGAIDSKELPEALGALAK